MCKHCPIDIDDQFPLPATPHGHLFPKKFLFAEGIHAAAIGFDIHETLSNEGSCALEGHNGFPENEGAGELAGEAAAEWGFGFVIGAVVNRANLPKAWRWLAYMTPSYGTALHLKGGIKWYSRCAR